MSKNQSFSSVVPDEVQAILLQLVQNDIIPVAVGGVARDFLFGKGSFLDWDFEIRCKDGCDFDLPQKLKSLFSDQVQDLGFGVLRLKTPTMQLEFSLPRREEFPLELHHLNKKPLGHKDVEIILDSSMSFEESFKRRDLTINAIGFKFENDAWTMIDPYQGAADIENKIARPVSQDFAFDPVRYLRAIRFKILFNLEFSKEMNEAFDASNLAVASDHYLLYESTKAGFFPFMRQFFDLVEQHKTKIPEEWEELKFLQYNEMPALFCPPDQLLLQATWQGPWTLSDLGKLERFLKLRRGRAKHFVTGKDFVSDFSEIDWSDKLSKWKQTAWIDLVQDELFLKCVEGHKHFDSWVVAEEQLLVELYQKELASFIAWRSIFSRSLKGSEAFSKNQKADEVLPSQRSIYKIYCHLKAD